MSMTLRERLEAWAIFYRDKARQPENVDKASLYEGYAAGIKRAIYEIEKEERIEK